MRGRDLQRRNICLRRGVSASRWPRISTLFTVIMSRTVAKHTSSMYLPQCQSSLSMYPPSPAPPSQSGL